MSAGKRGPRGKNHWRSRKGAASVLIVLLIVVLIFFGVLALVTAAADQRLAQRRADWNQQYYLADSLAEYVFANLDHLVESTVSSGQSAEDLSRKITTWLNAETVVSDFTLIRQPDSLVLQVLVYQPELSAQGIDLTLRIEPEAPEQQIKILGWQQWQPPIPEDDSAFERWEGAD